MLKLLIISLFSFQWFSINTVIDGEPTLTPTDDCLWYFENNAISVIKITVYVKPLEEDKQIHLKLSFTFL